MTTRPGMPRGAAIAINDLLDNCAQIQPGQQVLILAHVDGLYGGYNLVDEEAIAWMQAGVQQRGAHPTVVWVDEPFEFRKWRLPPVLKAALAGCDVMINNSFDLTWEEVRELMQVIGERGALYVRNFATTSTLLNTAWAQTPHELVSTIRVKAGTMFEERLGQPWTFTHPNGTHLRGKVEPARAMPYAGWRTNYRPFPEWVFPPISASETEGMIVFDRMLSWWPRYIGISPFFKQPVYITVEKGRITKFEGGDEAEAIKRFLDSLAQEFGQAVYQVSVLHGGVHPHSIEVGPHQCPDLAYRRLLEHSHYRNVHIHLGDLQMVPGWPYMLHVTADVLDATWQVGDKVVLDNGYLTALDDPEVRAIAERYPDRPGLTPELWR